ncbi:hypothetical protein ACHQM5_004742 [Ranunculus cassubicifolius]
MERQIQEKFSVYYERWMTLQGLNLQQLLSTPRDHPSSNVSQHKSLVSRSLNLFKEFYTVKWEGAHEDVLGFYSSPWLTPLENAHIWMTGWKPSILFKLVNSLRHARVPGSSLGEMDETQLKKMEKLKVRTGVEEQRVEREMERLQVSVADRRLVELAKLSGQMEISVEVNGLVDEAVNEVLVGLEKVMKMADYVRLKTMKEVLEVFSPLQCVDFMAGFLMLQIQLRNWGKRRDSRKIDMF